MDLSQFGLDTTNGTGGLTIPGLQGIESMFQTITTVSVIIGVLFLVLYVINLVQRMRADRAMIAMHKDIAAIRMMLESRQPQATTHDASVESQAPIRDESAAV